MGVAAHVVEDLVRPGEGRLGVDDPLGLPDRAQMIRQNLWVGKTPELPAELQLSGVDRLGARGEQEPAEQSREHADREEEAGTARDPARAILGQPAARDDTGRWG